MPQQDEEQTDQDTGAVSLLEQLPRELHQNLILTWSSKCTHLVKQLFSCVPTLFQIDLDSYSQEMNANDNCYKTWKYNSVHPAALHIVINSVAIEPVPA